MSFLFKGFLINQVLANRTVVFFAVVGVFLFFGGGGSGDVFVRYIIYP